MPIRFRCGNGHTLTVKDELIGATVRCPHCQTTVVVPGAPPEEDEELEDRPRRGGGRRNSIFGGKLSRAAKLRRVRLGLGFHFASLVVFLIGILLAILVPIAVASVGGGPFAGIVMLLARILITTAFLASPVLGIVGSALCAWVPKKTMQTFALIAFGLDLTSFGLVMVQTVLALTGFVPDSLAMVVLQFAQMGFHFAAWILFMLYLRRLARFLEEWGSADEAGNLIVFGAMLIAAPILFMIGATLFILAMSSRETVLAAQCFVGCFVLIGVIVWVIFIFKFMFRQLELLGHLRHALRRNPTGD